MAHLTPKQVDAFIGKQVIQVSLGPHHSCALLSQGEVYTWGQAGRLGHATQGAEVDEMLPRHVTALEHVFVVQVSCGHSHSAAISETGDVYAWGSSRVYGHTDSNIVPNQPTMIKMLSGKAIVQVSCAISHTIVLSDYKRLTGKAALAAARNIEVPDEEHEALGKAYANNELNAEMKMLQPPSHEREIVVLSQELKQYQDLTRTLAKQLQDSQNRLMLLINENSFLKSELEVMHQCAPSGDDRLDTLRRHFSDRMRDMERRHQEKENKWKITLAKYRLQPQDEPEKET